MKVLITNRLSHYGLTLPMAMLGKTFEVVEECKGKGYYVNAFEYGEKYFILYDECKVVHEDIRDNPVNGEIWTHYKGNNYRIVDVAQHSETREKMVVYRALYPPYSTWVRPLDMFMEQVSTANGSVPRFKQKEM